MMFFGIWKWIPHNWSIAWFSHIISCRQCSRYNFLAFWISLLYSSPDAGQIYFLSSNIDERRNANTKNDSSKFIYSSSIQASRATRTRNRNLLQSLWGRYKRLGEIVIDWWGRELLLQTRRSGTSPQGDMIFDILIHYWLFLFPLQKYRPQGHHSISTIPRKELSPNNW